MAVNERDDIVLKDCYKISGTAAKLSLKKAYHHCTLLCQVELSKLRETLQSDFEGINSNATASVSSRTKNLFGENAKFSWENFTYNMGNYFLERFSSPTGCDGVRDVDPLAGYHREAVLEAKHLLMDWSWNFGKTPKFHFEIEKQFPFSKIKLNMKIDKGIIQEILFEVSDQKLKDLISEYLDNFIGQRFHRSDILAACTYPVICNSNSSICNQISDWILAYLH